MDFQDFLYLNIPFTLGPHISRYVEHCSTWQTKFKRSPEPTGGCSDSYPTDGLLITSSKYPGYVDFLIYQGCNSMFKKNLSPKMTSLSICIPKIITIIRVWELPKTIKFSMDRTKSSLSRGHITHTCSEPSVCCLFCLKILG